MMSINQCWIYAKLKENQTFTFCTDVGTKHSMSVIKNARVMVRYIHGRDSYFVLYNRPGKRLGKAYDVCTMVDRAIAKNIMESEKEDGDYVYVEPMYLSRIEGVYTDINKNSTKYKVK